ncbi:MAG: bifunctional diaminohydroxyphosphoribosylaminopyrimidine deaminase/5-amino-6-(5-phosphoribosylamino)uracil reductase RibD [Endomicrobia bacterium]|nr:bifunctional diaminohydroxyphosphoribosylaminopyrimidine deaminase/5-amino-6-(5-phosphoribosylamino)uracil reductase RibD [Endomicrobiia bacterium]
MTSKDEKYIRYCFELAKKGLGYTSPNPIVGSVLVVDDEIISEGYHTGFGKPHAEIEAINNAIKKNKTHLLKKATLYVNLEPCCHWGKTPPCVDKIVEVGIKRVVCSMYDPNPKVRGKGIKKLKQKNIYCKVGVLQEEAKELNKFYIKWITKKLPYITIKSAMTFDGKIATPLGYSKWISSDASRDYVHKLRSIYDAVVVGINTVVKDNPKLSSYNKGRDPVRVIVGDINKLNLKNQNYNILDGKVKTIIFTNRKPINKKILINKNLVFYYYENKEIPFSFIFSKLAQEHLISSVLVEGGGETIWRIIRENLVDDYIIFISPKIFGGKHSKTWVEGEGVDEPSKAYSVKFTSIEQIGEDFVIKAKPKN